jgi:hypothetical protein
MLPISSCFWRFLSEKGHKLILATGNTAWHCKKIHNNFVKFCENAAVFLWREKDCGNNFYTLKQK